MRGRKRRGYKSRRRTVNYRMIEDDSQGKKGWLKALIVWIVEILLVIALAYFIIAYGVERTTMIGDSMNTTLEEGDKIIVNKMIYRFRSPKRFEVIALKQSGKEHGYYTIKRVIGLPGETVQIKDGYVYIDGEQIEEKVPVEKCANGGRAEEEITLDDGEFFVLGDNRNNSEDSRFANMGNVIKGDIIGKAWIRLHPFDFVNLINTGDKNTSKPEAEE